MGRQRLEKKKNKIKTLGTERCENIKTLFVNKMLLISRSMDLWKICISSLCSTDKLSFPSILILRFIL
jgi:hypothetical protein